jgi:hypothetical protein
MTTTITTTNVCPNCEEDSLSLAGNYEPNGFMFNVTERTCRGCEYSDTLIDGVIVNDDIDLSFEPVNSYAEATHAAAAAIDTVLAEINTKIAIKRRNKDRAIDSIARAEKANAERVAKGREPMARPYGIDIDREQYRIAKCDEHIAELEAEAAPLHALYSEHRWSRFFLVLNTNGHIHRDTSCSTCFITTDFGWLPELSGLTEADAVEQQGEILCSVCFPSAPVEWTNGTSNNDKAAKDERAALKAERLAKKTAKALVPEDIDGGLVVFVGFDQGRRERITTIAAAKTWLTDYFSWNAAYPHTWEDGTVVHHHPSYPPSALEIVADVYAARIGSTPEAEIEAAKKRAAKRR